MIAHSVSLTLSIIDYSTNNLPLFLRTRAASFPSTRTSVQCACRSQAQNNSARALQASWSTYLMAFEWKHDSTTSCTEFSIFIATSWKTSRPATWSFQGNRIPSVTSRKQDSSCKFGSSRVQSPVSGCKGWRTISLATRLIQTCFFIGVSSLWSIMLLDRKSSSSVTITLHTFMNCAVTFQVHGDRCGGLVVTTNPVNTVKRLCPLPQSLHRGTKVVQSDKMMRRPWARVPQTDVSWPHSRFVQGLGVPTQNPMGPKEPPATVTPGQLLASLPGATPNRY